MSALVFTKTYKSVELGYSRRRQVDIFQADTAGIFSSQIQTKSVHCAVMICLTKYYIQPVSPIFWPWLLSWLVGPNSPSPPGTSSPPPRRASSS